MDKFYTQKECDRCGGSLDHGRIMSMYNKDCICKKCKAIEVKRNDYKSALEMDHTEVCKGNYNFAGIGYDD